MILAQVVEAQYDRGIACRLVCLPAEAAKKANGRKWWFSLSSHDYMTIYITRTGEAIKPKLMNRRGD